MALFEDILHCGHVGEDEEIERAVCDTLQNVGDLVSLRRLLVSL